MDRVFTYEREKFEKGELTSKDIKKLIDLHESEVVPSLQEDIDYYNGLQAINEEDSEVDVQTVCNHAKDIADTASGYFLGNPITYRLKESSQMTDEKMQTLLDALSYAGSDDDDQENALMLSIAGITYEYVYVEEGSNNLLIEPLSPVNTFMVVDETIEHKELFAVYYYHKIDDTEEKKDDRLYIIVCDAENITHYTVEGGEDVEPDEVKPHNLGGIPIVEYKNNKYCIGDFEQQIGLIDAYNTLTSDRIQDKEQFIDSIMVIYGSLLGDTEEESKAAQSELEKRKLLELDSDSRVEYLTRTLDEGGAEVLRNAIKEDIYTFSHVPNLTDANFAGNSSGVAMEYKLLGLEMLTKTKERWYKRGLRKRLRLFLNYLSMLTETVTEGDIDVTFSRGLPKNLLELSQIVATLQGQVTQKTLISLLPFVENAEEEVEALKEERQEAAEEQAELMQLIQPANEEPEGEYPQEQPEEVVEE